MCTIPFLKRRLNAQETQILEQQFPFYSKLIPQQQRIFRHRVKSLMLDKHFTGRQGIEVTSEMQVLIAATAAMLTFGFRNFYIGLLERIVIYPQGLSFQKPIKPIIKASLIPN